MKSCPQRPQIYSDENLFCLSAGMWRTDVDDAQAAVLLDIKQSCIFQIIETEAIHFTESEAGALMICLSSLAAVLNYEI